MEQQIKCSTNYEWIQEIYVYTPNKQIETTYSVIYADDIIGVTTKDKLPDEYEAGFSRNFQDKNLGDCKYYFRLKSEHDKYGNILNTSQLLH
jgi:hypothetical protein